MLRSRPFNQIASTEASAQATGAATCLTTGWREIPLLIPVPEADPSVPESRSLRWLRIVGAYCIGMGVMHVLGLLRVLDLAKENPLPAWPLWLYATSYIYPVARIAAGMLLLSRSALAAGLMLITALCAASSLFILPAVWAKQIGFEIQYAPIQIVLSRLDFVLTIVIAWAVFRWRSQGLLRSHSSVARDVRATSSLPPHRIQRRQNHHHAE